MKQSSSDNFLSEINVTPLVDVMLVLLIIFMISAPLLLNNVPLVLPKTKKVEKLSPKADRVIISLDAQGEVYLNQEKILMNQLRDKLKKLAKNITIYLQADEKVPYGKVAKIMSDLKSEGLTQLSLITEIDSPKKK